MALRGECLLYTGNADSAKKHFQKALRDEPDNARAQLLYKRLKKLEAAKDAANTLYKQGKYTDACAAYGEALLVVRASPSAPPSQETLACGVAANHERVTPA